jgi:hypothetical protein
VTEKEKPILYKCPYCKEGRFTAEDGWEGAVRHIEEKHGRFGASRRRYFHSWSDSELDGLGLFDEDESDN